jgi:hypothetical protein
MEVSYRLHASASDAKAVSRQWLQLQDLPILSAALLEGWQRNYTDLSQTCSRLSVFESKGKNAAL